MKIAAFTIKLAALAASSGAFGQTEARPVVSPYALISHHDYPEEALRSSEEGRVRFRVDLDASGAVSGCTTVESSGSASLDAVSCRIMTTRARFHPATDASGEPVPSSFTSTIEWWLGESSGGEERVNGVVQLWVDCLMGEAAKLSPTDVSPEAVPTRAFAACASLEPALAAALRESGGPTRAAEPLQGIKKTFRAVIAERLAAARETLRRAYDGE